MKSTEQMKKLTLIFFLLFLNNNITYSQSDNLGITTSINFIKPFLGLVNFDIQVRILKHYALHFYVEKEFREKLNHPDLFAKIGTRYYLSSKEEFLSKTFLRMNIAFARSKDKDEEDGFLLGSEIGYKFMIWKRVSVVPMGLIHYPIRNVKLVWGFEAPFGISF